MANTPRGRPEEPEPRGEGQATRLLAWYERVKRPLPWREDDDPYRVWLSEVMLQQTRVETAIPYYQRFLDAFPSVSALARASEDEVQALWSGLGYYRRARMLLAAAREVVRSGGFPKTAEGWRRLPGVGPCTAAAVASSAYHEKVVALDGNLERVLARRALRLPSSIVMVAMPSSSAYWTESVFVMVLIVFRVRGDSGITVAHHSKSAHDKS